MSQQDDDRNRDRAGSGSVLDRDLDVIPDAVFVADTDTGRIVEANAAAGDLFHCQPTDLIGRHQSALHPSDDGDYAAAFERATGGERVNRHGNGQPLYIETVDGQHTPVEITVKRLDRREGNFVLGVFREVTDQLHRERRLEAATSRLETLLDALPVPVAVLDVDGTIERWNQASERTFGYDREAVVGEPYPLFIEDAEFDLLFEQILDGGVLDGYETVYRSQDGSRIPVEVYARPIYENDAFSGVAGAAIDLSNRQQIEQQVDILHRVLRHNLRNELTIIRGWTQELTNDDSKRETAIEKITTASDRLLALSEEARRIRTGLTGDVTNTDSLPITTVVARLTKQVTERDPGTTINLAEQPESGAIPSRGAQAVSQLLDSVLNHVGEVTLELAIETHDQYLLLELTAPVSLLPTGERSLIETGEETALEHGSGLEIAQAHLVLQSIGGVVTIESESANAPASRLSVELPRTDGENRFRPE